MDYMLVAGRYELFSSHPVGKGAFCHVYKGKDRQTNTEVAIKIVLEGKSAQLKFESRLLQNHLRGYRTS